jgi:putative sigma-54 modulation protein
MRIDIKARKVAMTDDLRIKVEKRFEKIARQVPEAAQLELELSEDQNPRVSDKQIAEATLHLKGTTLRAHEAAGNMVTAINNVADDMARQVKRYRAKRSGRRDAPARAVSAEAAPPAF